MNHRSRVRFEILLVFVLNLALLLFLSRTVHCEGITWSGPRPTPAEAARIMAEAPGLANRTHAPAPLPEDGPTVVILSGSATAGPFGAIATPQLPVHPPCCFPAFYGYGYGYGFRPPVPVSRPPHSSSPPRR